MFSFVGVQKRLEEEEEHVWLCGHAPICHYQGPGLRWTPEFLSYKLNSSLGCSPVLRLHLHQRVVTEPPSGTNMVSLSAVGYSGYRHRARGDVTCTVAPLPMSCVTLGRYLPSLCL